ncbi:hypothetical protein [Variovorax sp. LG9.2]|nr:hypothetical protein [Variovorax sp. LG9.2]
MNTVPASGQALDRIATKTLGERGLHCNPRTSRVPPRSAGCSTQRSETQ